LTFDNININIAKYGNYTQDTLDYRPSYRPDVLPGPINGFYFEYCQDIDVKESSVNIGVNTTNIGKCFAEGMKTTGINVIDTKCNGKIIN